MFENQLENDHKLKYPPNAFMIFLNQMNGNISNQSPSLTENEIFRTIGRMWFVLPEDIKDNYRLQSKELRDNFKKLNPDYLEKNRKKRNLNINERIPIPIKLRVILDDEQKNDIF